MKLTTIGFLPVKPYCQKVLIIIKNTKSSDSEMNFKTATKYALQL